MYCEWFLFGSRVSGLVGFQSFSFGGAVWRREMAVMPVVAGSMRAKMGERGDRQAGGRVVGWQAYENERLKRGGGAAQG